MQRNTIKKRALILAALVILLSACKKNWQCNCTEGGKSITISKAHKAEAASECAAWQVRQQDTVQKANCSI